MTIDQVLTGKKLMDNLERQNELLNNLKNCRCIRLNVICRSENLAFEQTEFLRMLGISHEIILKMLIANTEGLILDLQKQLEQL